MASSLSSSSESETGYGAYGGYTMGEFDAVQEQDNAARSESRSMHRQHQQLDHVEQNWASKEAKDAPLSKDWNTAYQEAMEMEPCERKFQLIRDIARDFSYAASVYARIIVAEVCVPDGRKTIGPALGFGGSAGGKKYVCNGILFKFALDTELAPGLWMYGGSARDDELAMKAGNHSLKGLIAWMSSSPPGLCFPLMSLIDYKGYRLIATSLLPIDDSTMLYGSNDGGRHILTDDERLASLFEQASRSMGIGPLVLRDGRKIFGPSDIEGHLGRDGRYYAVDFARTFPAEYMPRSDARYHPRSLFFNLLRAEFCRFTDMGLVPDVFSGFMGATTPDFALRSNRAAYAAYQKLHSEVIPKFAQFLVLHYDLGSQRHLGDIEQVALVMEDIRFIVQETHRRGINLRHLGCVRDLVPESSVHLRLMLLTQMACATIKSELRRGHREIMEHLTFPSDAPFRRVALRIFNTLIGKSGADLFWTQTIKSLIVAKYGRGLSTHELHDSVDLRSHLSLRMLLLRLQETTYITFSAGATSDLTANPHSFVFTDSDVEAMSPVIKSLHMVDWAEANLAYMRAVSPAVLHTNESLRLLVSAHAHLEAALKKATTSASILHMLVRTLRQLAVTSWLQQLELEAPTLDEESESLLDTEEEPQRRRHKYNSQRRHRASTANLFNIPGHTVSFGYLRRAVKALERLMMHAKSLPSDERANRDFLARVNRLSGHILGEVGHQIEHDNRKSGAHFQWFQKAVSSYAAAFRGEGRGLFYASLVQECRAQLSNVNNQSAALALHNLRLRRLECTAMVEVAPDEDMDMLLLLGEMEVALSKRVESRREAKGLRAAAQQHFATVLQGDSARVADYYRRKQNVLYALVAWKPESELAQFVASLEPATRKVSGYPRSPVHYNLVKAIKDREGYSDSCGVLWECTLISTGETLAVKIVDNSMWRRCGGRMPDHVIQKRERLVTPRVVHFLAVFNDSNGSTWFVMPKYRMSAFSMLKRFSDTPSRVVSAVMKLTIQALVELHAEGLPHCKLTFRNMLLVAPEGPKNELWSLKLTNKAARQINTLLFRNITNQHTTFSASKLRRALCDYDLSPLEAALFASGESEAEEDSDISSSSDTGGMLSLGEVVRREEKPVVFNRIAKSEDVVAVCKILLTVSKKVQAGSGNSSEKKLWRDAEPYLRVSVDEGLVKLQELLAMPLFSTLDAERVLSAFMNRHDVHKEAVTSPVIARAQKREEGVAADAQVLDEDAFMGQSPVELVFASGSRRDKMYARLEEGARRILGSSDGGAPSSRRSAGRSWGRSTSPRSRNKALDLGSMVFNVMNGSPSKSKTKARSIANIFSSSPPSSRVVVPPQREDELNMDWVAAFSVFFYNKLFLLWSSLSPPCTCTEMKGSNRHGLWLWRDTKQDRVVSVSAAKYAGLVLHSLYSVIFRHNLLNSRISMDLSSSATIVEELREVMRRLARLFYHLSTFHRESEAAEPEQEEQQEEGHLETEEPEPLVVRKSFGKSTSRRLSRERTRKSLESQERALLGPEALWPVFETFCNLIKVNMAEAKAMQAPLFAELDME